MVRRRILFLLTVLLAFAYTALPARADESAPYENMHLDVQLQADGSAKVAMSFTMRFDENPGRGPLLQFYTVQDDEKHPGQQYVYSFSEPNVTSPTGAKSDLDVDTETNAVIWRIGDKDYTYQTPQEYHLEFELKGMTWDEHPDSKLAEFNWQVFSDIASEIRGFSATVRSVAAPELARCFTGSGNLTPCEARVDGDTAMMSLDQIPRGQGVQIVAAFKAGTFGGVTPTTRRTPSLWSNLTPGWAIGGGSVAIAAVIGFGTWAIKRRLRRDLVYLSMTPGIAPRQGEQATIGYRDSSKLPVAVQFQPPKGATPGEIGTLIDAKADGIDVSASIIDLAVRGYLRIIPKQNSDEFTMQALNKPHDDLAPFERNLLEGIFAGSSERTTQELADKKFHTVMSQAREDLYAAVSSRKWFVKNPSKTQIIWGLLGIVPFSGGIILSIVLWDFSLALIGLPFIVFGISAFGIVGTPTRRTPQGSAVLQQSRGFELYLRTAEANQIKFEEDIDVFSRYLPYAMIFGVADRWAQAFAELERAGQYQTDLTWAGGDFTTAYAYSTMAKSFCASFASAAHQCTDSYLASLEPSASSGVSGLSGGGGFGGGSAGSW